MTANGLGGSYGTPTQFDPSRSVSRQALPQTLASRLHYKEGRSAKDVLDMSDEEWSPLSRDNLIDRNQVVAYLRAYESYQ